MLELLQTTSAQSAPRFLFGVYGRLLSILFHLLAVFVLFIDSGFWTLAVRRRYKDTTFMLQTFTSATNPRANPT